MLYRFSTVLLTNWYTNGLREMSDRKSEHIDVAAAEALGVGATCDHTNRSITFLKVFAI